MDAPASSRKTVWLPRTGLLEPGDILLTRGVYGTSKKGATLSKAIVGITGGAFDHAAICTSPPTCAEAGLGGVSTLSIARTFAHDIANVRLLRVADQAAAARAAGLAQHQVGRPYSKLRAVSSVMKGVKVAPQDRGVFCSSLVAMVFRDAGAPEFEGIIPDKTTPADLAALPGLIDLTTRFLFCVVAPANITAMSALDGDRTYSPATKQTDVLLEYAVNLLPLSDRLAADFPELNLPPPASFFELLNFMMLAWDRRDKVSPLRREELDVAISRLDQEITGQLAGGGLLDIQSEMVAIDTKSMMELTRRSYDANPNIDLDGLKQLLVARIKSLDSRLEDQATFASYLPHLRSIAAWEAIDAKTICSMQLSMRVQSEVLERMGLGVARATPNG